VITDTTTEPTWAGYMPTADAGQWVTDSWDAALPVMWLVRVFVGQQADEPRSPENVSAGLAHDRDAARFDGERDRERRNIKRPASWAGGVGRRGPG
jgi:hypothetical protein